MVFINNKTKLITDKATTIERHADTREAMNGKSIYEINYAI